MTQNQGKSFYKFDINSTTKCNLRCTYCIEHDWFKKPEEKQTAETTEKIFEKIDHLLESQVFLEKYSGIGINFWGGEPTMNPKFIDDMVTKYGTDDRVGFFIYSNGYNISKVVSLLEKYRNSKTTDGNPKVLIQVSYDGKASHDVARLNVHGVGSADTVKETLTMLRDKKIPYTTKATIDFANLGSLFDNYMEHLQMVKDGYNINHYGPTIDYLSDYEFTQDEMDNFKKILKEQVFKMAKYEIDYYKTNGRFFFAWMNDNRALCSAGENMSLIDVNGDVLVCHGAIYETNRESHKLTSLDFSNIEFTDSLMNHSKKYHEARVDKPLPLDCGTCIAHFCMKCNVKKASISDKEEYFEKWTDYSSQDHLCQIYKYMAVLKMAIMKKL